MPQSQYIQILLAYPYYLSFVYKKIVVTFLLFIYIKKLIENTPCSVAPGTYTYSFIDGWLTLNLEHNIKEINFAVSLLMISNTSMDARRFNLLWHNNISKNTATRTVIILINTKLNESVIMYERTQLIIPSPVS